jgi:hypothetical protein
MHDFGPDPFSETHLQVARGWQRGDVAVFVMAEQVTTRLPVRSALFKQQTGGLVVR